MTSLCHANASGVGGSMANGTALSRDEDTEEGGEKSDREDSVEDCHYDGCGWRT